MLGCSSTSQELFLHAKLFCYRKLCRHVMQICMNFSRLDWDDLRLFLAIARAGTLTAAAETLRLSQPTAGRRLRALEDVCGCALFQRNPAGLQLTDEGEIMLLHAERMEEEALALQRQFAGADGALQGHLRLSSSEWFATHVLAPAVASFTAQNPLVAVEIVADVRLLSLERREADLVFRFRTFDAPDIVQRRFTSVRYGLYAAASYLDRHGLPGPGETGEGHRLIAMDRQFDRLADVSWLRARFPQARMTLRSNSRDVQAQVCMEGGGLAVLPRLLGEKAGLTEIAAADPPPGRDVWLGYHADLKRLRRLRGLVDHLTSAIPDPL
jgi:DNA-binding transcriptional LysR family regulator